MILNNMIKIKKFKSKILFKINKLIKEVLKKKLILLMKLKINYNRRIN